jgi:hypothetical protein
MTYSGQLLGEGHMNDKEDRFRRDNVICREFGVRLFDGTTARLAFTLADDKADTVAATIARRAEARMHGLAFILEHPRVQPRTLVWLQTERGLALCGPEEDGGLDDDLQQLVADLAERFLVDLALIAAKSPSDERQISSRTIDPSLPGATSTPRFPASGSEDPLAAFWRAS